MSPRLERIVYVIAAPKGTGRYRQHPHSTHITSGISRAINNCQRNRGSNVCRRRCLSSESFPAADVARGGARRRDGHVFSARTLSPRHRPYMNLHVHVRAVRAGVSLYKTALPLACPSPAPQPRSCPHREPCFAPPWWQREKKGTAGGLGFSARGGTGAVAQTGGYIPVQMSPCGARITVTYEDGNTYSRAHRLTSLVMRLLFPPRGKLFRRG